MGGRQGTIFIPSTSGRPNSSRSKKGRRLPDLSAAEHEAILAERDILGEAIKSGRPEGFEGFDRERRAERLAIVPV